MRFKKQFELIEHYYNLFIKLYMEYKQGSETIYAVERLAELLIQSILDLAAMFVSMRRNRKPSTYRELAEYLSELLGLDEDYKAFITGLAGFRNILVHGYAQIRRDLEEEAFQEIRERMSVIIDLIKEKLPDDPCIDEVVEKIKRVASRWENIEYIVLFGSLARSGCGNDVDLAVKGRFHSGIDLGRLLVELADELRLPLEKIDLVLIDDAPIGLLKTIIDEGIIIYGDRDKALDDLYRKYLSILDRINEEKAIENKIRNYRRRILQSKNP